MSTRRLQIEAYRWQSRQFGGDDKRTPAGPLNHLRRELDEIIADPTHEEFGDALLLLLDAISLAGLSYDAVLHHAWNKLDVNRNREWAPLDEEGVSEHVKEPDELDGEAMRGAIACYLGKCHDETDNDGVRSLYESALTVVRGLPQLGSAEVMRATICREIPKQMVPLDFDAHSAGTDREEIIAQIRELYPVRETAPHFVLVNAAGVYTKDGDFFREQQGLTEEWGGGWEAIDADGLEESRKIGIRRRRFRFPESHKTLGEA